MIRWVVVIDGQVGMVVWRAMSGFLCVFEVRSGGLEAEEGARYAVSRRTSSHSSRSLPGPASEAGPQVVPFFCRTANRCLSKFRVYSTCSLNAHLLDELSSCGKKD